MARSSALARAPSGYDGLLTSSAGLAFDDGAGRARSGCLLVTLIREVRCTRLPGTYYNRLLRISCTDEITTGLKRKAAHVSMVSPARSLGGHNLALLYRKYLHVLGGRANRRA